MSYNKLKNCDLNKINIVKEFIQDGEENFSDISDEKNVLL